MVDPRLHILSFDSVTSTMDAALSAIEAGKARPFTLIKARSQTQGRGRQGRRWETPEDAATVTLALQLNAPQKNMWQLSFVAAVGVHKALSTFLAEPLQLKWPNDFLLEERKLGGILVEMHHQKTAAGETVLWAVIGVGINVGSIPDAFLAQAASLSKYWHEPVSLDHLVDTVSQEILESYDMWCEKGFEPLRVYWMNHSLPEDRLMTFHQPNGLRVRGYSRGIDDKGYFLMETLQGECLRFHGGDVILGEGLE